MRISKRNQKAGKGLKEKRAGPKESFGGVWPAALKLFSVLIFLVLFVSRQKGLATAAIERRVSE
jgi:hypothetical protein